MAKKVVKTKAEKVTLDQWIKSLDIFNWKDALYDALKTYIQNDSHPAILLDGPAIKIANEVYKQICARNKSAPIGSLFPTNILIGMDMAKMLNIQPNDIVFDPGCGFGNLLYAVSLLNDKVELYGVEINEWVVKVAIECADDKTHIRKGNFLDGYNVPKGITKVIANPPFGSAYSVANAEYHFMRRLIDTCPGALACVILPPTFWTKTVREFAGIQKEMTVMGSIELKKAFKPFTNNDFAAYLIQLPGKAPSSKEAKAPKNDKKQQAAPAPVKPPAALDPKNNLKPDDPMDCCEHAVKMHIRNRNNEIVCLAFGCHSAIPIKSKV